MQRRKLKWMIGTLAFAVISGCAVTSAVIPAGQDAYHVSVVGARYETQTDANLKALRIANDYCGNMSKHVMFRQSTESSEHPWSAKQEDLTFVCMDDKDPAYMRAAVDRAPTVVAQQ
jgi:hypothetical protein